MSAKEIAKGVSIGSRFGRLVVVSEAERDKSDQKRVNCVCDCGNTSFVYTGNLRSGNTTSCGCYCKDINTKSGLSRTPLYKVWSAAEQRCNNPNAKVYHRYGGRGVGFCDEWRDFANFADWAINRSNYEPDKNLSLERRDNNGNYEPSNCYWLDKGLNCAHTSRTRIVIRSDGLFFFNASFAARTVRRTKGSSITQCCRGKAITTAGYSWRYATEEEIIRIKTKYGQPLD